MEQSEGQEFHEGFDHEDYQYRDGEHEMGSQQYDQQQHYGEDSHNLDIYHDSQSMPKESQSISPRQQHQRRSASEELNASFERDVHSMTKVKATIIYNINQERQKNSLPQMYEDITLSSIAMQFATSLKDNDYDKNYLEKLKQLQRNDIDFKISYIRAAYEEDTQITKINTINYFIQMGYLFFEIDQDRRILLDSSYNHIGLGLAGSQTHIVVVLFMAQRDISITEIVDKGQNIVQIRGKMLDYTVGIYGVKIFNNDSFDKIKKDKQKPEPEAICTALFDKIDFNRITKEYCVYLQIQSNWKQKRWVELLTRDNPDAIPYRKPRKEKDKEKSYFRGLKPKLRAIFQEYPNKQYLQYYEQLNQLKKKKNNDLLEDLIKKQQQERLKAEEEMRIELNQQQAEESEKVPSDQESEPEQQPKQDHKEGGVSNKQIREELQQAITEAKSTYDNLLINNRELQQKIKQLKSKTESYVDKTGEMTMNEHKYLNTLTQVHQTRVDLQTTQDRYNRMSIELQNKLNQKQAKCNQIRIAFLQLKREVARKAAYSRSDMPIKSSKIDEWEQREKKLAQELQTLRLQILRARNTLAKNQKILKKKQQLAEGLHLIDFEQLKIENQTLNEKIEQRNQDLHKLKKKTTTIVQILTHTREKLGFVTAFRNQLEKKQKELDEKIKVLRNEMSLKKQACQELKIQIQDAKQQTEIVNSTELVADFKRRNKDIQQLEKDIKKLQVQQKEMKTVIENYQRKMRKQVIKK